MSVGIISQSTERMLPVVIDSLPDPRRGGGWMATGSYLIYAHGKTWESGHFSTLKEARTFDDEVYVGPLQLNLRIEAVEVVEQCGIEKVCHRCGIKKLLTEFHADKRLPDGRRHICKECTIARQATYAETHTAERQSSDVAYKAILGLDERRRRAREAARRHRSKRREYSIKWRSANPEKHAAHIAVRKAVRLGQIIRASKCERCGIAAYLEASHCDYSKPLDVEWLCPPCHKEKDQTGWKFLSRNKKKNSPRIE